MKALNFSVKVQCKGHAVGTIGWLNEILSNGELVIKNTKSGGAGMFFHEFTRADGTPRDANERNTFICKLVNSLEETDGYNSRKHGDFWLIYISPVGEYMYKNGFSDYPMTYAATSAMEEFIEKACDTYLEWWDNDK